MAMKESEFNADFVKAVRKLGIFCYKTSDRFQTGVPDVYIQGGLWSEGKQISMQRLLKGGRPISAMNWIEPPQQAWLNKLDDAGDYCFIHIDWVSESGRGPGSHRFTFMPWRLFKQVGAWGNPELEMLSVEPYRTSELPVEIVLDPNAERKFHVGRASQMFEAWKAHRPFMLNKFDITRAASDKLSSYI